MLHSSRCSSQQRVLLILESLQHALQFIKLKLGNSAATAAAAAAATATAVHSLHTCRCATVTTR